MNLRFAPTALLISAVIFTTGCGAPHQNDSSGGESAQTPDIRSEEVRYEVDGNTFLGWIAWDAAREGARPGVLVVHEWWGHNSYTRERARMLAELGYTGFAIDMFGEGKQASHPEQAMAFVQEAISTAAGAKARFDKAYALLRSHATVDSSAIAAIGYCFGGTVVLEMARAGADLDVVASFHGGLGTDNPAQEGVMRARVLSCTGADDPMIPQESVAAFGEEMRQAGVEADVIAYPGVVHAFTNPAADSLGRAFDMPLAYDAQADAHAWNTLVQLLSTTFDR